MNNLLRTLTELQSKSTNQSDLKLLLTTVKEARRQTLETKLADPFYDSLEGLLLDLRTVTIDNRDAEAFLKPVPKTEYPDYYDVIATPMDLQTMLKKVKAKSYKSKREFQDDLDLIWSNCFQYNATENHPLRLCVLRLKAKAETLLKYVTDRKDRSDPSIPGEILSSRGLAPKVNGTATNDIIGLARTRSIRPSKSPSPAKTLSSDLDGYSRKDVPFPDSFAILRTQAGMSVFRQLDHDLDVRLESLNLANGHRGMGLNLEDRLRLHGARAEVQEGNDEDDMSLRTYDGETGEKRKLNGFVDVRPRKRTRMSSEEPAKDVVELWWDALRSEELIGNGLPTLCYSSSESVPDELSPSRPVIEPSHAHLSRLKKKRKKKAEVAQPDTLLYHMNNNIKTLRKVRITHAKFAAISQTTEDGTVQPPEFSLPPTEDVEEPIDERPWRAKGSGIDVGVESSDACLHWAGTKVLEHAGFQGTSKAALDVLAGVTSDFFLNIGRTIRFLSEKHAHRMSSEEIILHTLFESGTAKITELERYVKDDIVRYGIRLSELEKKLANAYSDATTVEAWDDDALFKEEDEEEEGEFVMGNFADSYGEDFLGLRELGIAAEFGLSSLSIPKKLLKNKKQGIKEGPMAAKPIEPPLPFPVPPPFIPITSENVDSQIGLLRPYYQERIASLAAQQPVSQPPDPNFFPSTLNGTGLKPEFGYPAPVPYPPPPPPATNTIVVLPDDPPNPSHTKIGPLGQITKSAPAASSKKKSKAKPKPDHGDVIGGVVSGGTAPDGSAEGGLETPVMTPRAHLPSESPKKHKGVGGGSGTGKKKAKAVDPPLPSVVMASA